MSKSGFAVFRYVVSGDTSSESKGRWLNAVKDTFDSVSAVTASPYIKEVSATSSHVDIVLHGLESVIVSLAVINKLGKMPIHGGKKEPNIFYLQESPEQKMRRLKRELEDVKIKIDHCHKKIQSTDDPHIKLIEEAQLQRLRNQYHEISRPDAFMTTDNIFRGIKNYLHQRGGSIVSANSDARLAGFYRIAISAQHQHKSDMSELPGIHRYVHQESLGENQTCYRLE